MRLRGVFPCLNRRAFGNRAVNTSVFRRAARPVLGKTAVDDWLVMHARVVSPTRKEPKDAAAG